MAHAARVISNSPFNSSKFLRDVCTITPERDVADSPFSNKVKSFYNSPLFDVVIFNFIQAHNDEINSALDINTVE